MRARRRIVAIVLLAAAVLAVNLWTAAPDLIDGDGAELQALAVLGGIPHPSGYPTWALIARAFGAASPSAAVFRATALSACAGAAAIAALAALLLELGIGLAPALAVAALYAAGFTFRLASIRPETYTLAILLLVLAFRRALVAARSGRRRDLAAAGLLMGLALTGHFAMAPALAILGGWLALRPAQGLGRAARVALLGAAFVAGLLPYLYLATQDQPGHPMNYLATTIELGARQFGLDAASFAHPWQRIGWLVLGHEARPTNFLLHPSQLLYNLEALGAHALLFDPGPIALAIAGFGLVTAWRDARAHALLVAAIAATSFLFAAAFTFGKLLAIFSLPATLALAILAAFGLDARVRQASGARAAIVWGAAIVLLGGGVLLAQALRVGAITRPIGPLGWHVEEKPPRIERLWPRLDDYREARRYGEEALRTIPAGAFVIGRWNEIAVLRYLREVEGRRRDLTLDAYYPEHRLRLERWQATHDVALRPFVFLSRWPGLYVAPSESLEIRPGRWMLVQRAPIAAAPPAATQASVASGWRRVSNGLIGTNGASVSQH